MTEFEIETANNDDEGSKDKFSQRNKRGNEVKIIFTH